LQPRAERRGMGTRFLESILADSVFWTEAEANDLCDVAAAVISGDYTTEKRMMLSGVMPDGKKVTALNDIAVSRHYV
jgi:NAD kinase